MRESAERSIEKIRKMSEIVPDRRERVRKRHLVDPLTSQDHKSDGKLEKKFGVGPTLRWPGRTRPRPGRRPEPSDPPTGKPHPMREWCRTVHRQVGPHIRNTIPDSESKVCKKKWSTALVGSEAGKTWCWSFATSDRSMHRRHLAGLGRDILAAARCCQVSGQENRTKVTSASGSNDFSTMRGWCEKCWITEYPRNGT